MPWIVARIKGIMLVAGVLTGTMLYAVAAPEAALQSMFGEGLEGPLARTIVRNWAALIATVGAMLIYGAYHAVHRVFILTIAGLTKIVFIGLVVSHGSRYLAHQAGVAVGVDAIMVMLFALYIAASARVRPVAEDR